jgi:cell division protein FtsW (lipid II flippase)
MATVTDDRRAYRPTEALLLLFIAAVASLGFALVTIALQVQANENPLLDLPGAVLPPFVIFISFAGIHMALRLRRMEGEQVILPIVGLLLSIGMIMIWRLIGHSGVWQQIWRGLIPGLLIAAWFISQPRLIERVRRWTMPICIVGLLLPFATAYFGVVDETGARLALKLGPLPPIQTSEMIKLALVIFLAWYIDREGKAVEGRARVFLGWLRLPALRYFIPGILFVSLATLALVEMSDFGAVLILGFLFVGMLYAGFETRIFASIAGIGLILSILVGLILSLTWEVPTVIQYRFLAYLDPWSATEIVVGGLPSGVTVAEGPGYQIQQAIYAIIAGGISGAGLGFGSPEYIPLAHSDFIFAAIVEEMGLGVGIALLTLFGVLLLRILRIAIRLPRQQVFERLLVTGIAIHLFTQVFVMVSGTLNLLPMTGVTIPFVSQGGAALMVNLAEIGMVLAIAQRLEGKAV